jgi:putative restriction endonuclease
MSTKSGRAWTRDELILAVNLYCKTPFGKIHVRNPNIIRLAELMDRSPGSVGYKLANFASIDPSLARKGMANVSKLDKVVWAEFFADWDAMAFESEQRMAELTGAPVLNTDEEDIVIPPGKTEEAVVRRRVNQGFFRKMVLASYEQKCCITGLAITALLNASHIVPWAADASVRTDPRNGLCLNALHDRAFDRGLITVDEGFRVVVSRAVAGLPQEKAGAIQEVAGRKLVMPRRFVPDQAFLEFHRTNIFEG